MHTKNDVVSPVPVDMYHLLEQFTEIFQPPTQLPPSREIEHHITLKEGTYLINVCPYRYAHFQKAKIEKQVQEMLQSSLIRLSSSPFSSPILLLKRRTDHDAFVPTTAHSTQR